MKRRFSLLPCLLLLLGGCGGGRPPAPEEITAEELLQTLNEEHAAFRSRPADTESYVTRYAGGERRFSPAEMDRITDYGDGGYKHCGGAPVFPGRAGIHGHKFLFSCGSINSI